jgi:intracellular multiplication protein IcmK
LFRINDFKEMEMKVYKVTLLAALMSSYFLVNAQQVNLPSGTVPVGVQPTMPSAVSPSTSGIPQATSAPMAGLPAGAQPAPTVGAPVAGANGGQAQIPQNLPPLPANAPVVPNFEEVMAQTLGLTPEQIRELRRQQNVRQKAASELPVHPPRPVMSSVTASAAPGSVAPVIRLFTGFASAITVVDSTGALWPITNYTVGHDKLFDVRRMDKDEGSMLSVVPLGNYAQSNMVLYLKGLSAPIVLSFVSGQKEVDYRTDVRVQGMGPNAQITVGGLPASTNPVLYTVLDGVPPSDSKELKVSGGDARVWLSKNGRMYIRTSMKVISPTWIGSARSPDGMSAYEMMPANSIRVFRAGRIETVGVEGW